MEPYIVYFRAHTKCFLPPVGNAVKMKTTTTTTTTKAKKTMFSKNHLICYQRETLEKVKLELPGL